MAKKPKIIDFHQPIVEQNNLWKEKLLSGYKVLDKETKTLRPCKYDDFCILIDRKNGFEIYKKIFEYLDLPLLIYYDEKITNEKDILVLKNLIDLMCCLSLN